MQVVTQFLRLETLLDDSVGREIDLQIERGGVPLTVKLQVFGNFDVSYHVFFYCNISVALLLPDIDCLYNMSRF